MRTASQTARRPLPGTKSKPSPEVLQRSCRNSGTQTQRRTQARLCCTDQTFASRLAAEVTHFHTGSDKRFTAAWIAKMTSITRNSHGGCLRPEISRTTTRRSEKCCGSSASQHHGVKAEPIEPKSQQSASSSQAQSARRAVAQRSAAFPRVFSCAVGVASASRSRTNGGSDRASLSRFPD